MGLDGVEFIIAVEEAFNLTIPDEAIPTMATPRQVIDCVYAQLQHGDSPACLTQRAFYRLRRAAQSRLSLPRSALRPTTPWAAVLPEPNRSTLWQQLHHATGTKRWPPLVRSRTVIALIIGTALIGAFITQWHLAGQPHAMLLSTGVGFSWLTFLLMATKSLRLHFSPATATVGGTVEFLVTYSPATIKGVGGEWTRKQVREVIHRLIREQLGINEFTDDARFVEDLGVD